MRSVRSFLSSHATWLWLMIKVAVACAMLWFLFHQGALDLRPFLDGTVNLRIILVGLALNLVVISVGAVRWHMLLMSQGIILPLSWTHKMTYLAMCFNFLVPGSVGGDALRLGYMLQKTETVPKSAAILTIFADRLVGLYSLFVMAFVVLLFNMSAVLAVLPLRLLAISLAMLVGGGPLCLLLLLWGAKHLPFLRPASASSGGSSWLARFLGQMLHAISLFVKAKGRLMVAFVCSVVTQSVEIIALLWIAQGLGILTSPADHFFVAAPLAWVANVLPVSPGGLGVGEAAFAQICQWLQPAPTAFGTIFLINRLLLMMASLPGLWVYLTYRK